MEETKLHDTPHRCQVSSVLTTDPRIRAAYAEGAGIYRLVPSAVAIPSDVADVVELIHPARGCRTPGTPGGAGRGRPGGQGLAGQLDRLPKTRKTSSGYALDRFAESGDELDLLVGSEGTLGIVTAVHWRLDPIPPDTAGAALGFADLDAMAEAVPYLVSLNPSALELLDDTLLRFVPDAPCVACLLLVEFERETAAAARGAVGDAVRRLKHVVTHFGTAIDRAGLEQLWSVRRLASPALARLPLTQRSLQVIEDGCVPPIRLAEYVRGLRQAAARHSVPVAIFGHAGDAHVHVYALPDLTRPH